jgi:hypothetical protein
MEKAVKAFNVLFHTFARKPEECSDRTACLLA